MFSKYIFSFLFHAGVSRTDQYFLFADFANTLLNSASVAFISSGDFCVSTGTTFAAGLPSFSTKNSSPLYMARLSSSKNLFLASVAEIVFIVNKVYTTNSPLVNSTLILLYPYTFIPLCSYALMCNSSAPSPLANLKQ